MTPFYRLTFTCLLAGSGLLASGQITLDESLALQPGDVDAVYVQEDYTDPAGNIARSGANQTWRFETRPGTLDYTTVVRAASDGSAVANFPDASLAITTQSRLGGFDRAAELYVRRGTRGLELLGITSGNASDGLPSLRLTQPLLYAPAPLTFGAAASDDGDTRLTFGSRILTAVTGDPSFSTVVDSVRLRIRQSVSYEVDGWGQIKVGDAPGVDALRLKTTIAVRQGVEVKVSPLGWIDITNLEVIPDTLLPATRINAVDYAFLTAQSPFPAYRIRVDTLGRPLTLEASGQTIVGMTERANPADDLSATLRGDQLTVATSSPRATSDQLAVYGTDGRLLATERLPAGQTAATFSTAGWPQGLHLVTLWRGGAVAATTRVSILR